MSTNARDPLHPLALAERGRSRPPRFPNPVDLVRRFLNAPSGHTTRSGELQQILDAAEQIAQSRNPSALRDYVRVLGRMVQSELHAAVFRGHDVDRDQDAHAAGLWFPTTVPLTKDGRELWRLWQEVELDTPRTVELCRDLVMPWPWELSRAVDTMVDLCGEGGDAWEHDLTNHKLEIWEPFGVVWVHGGNHSLAAGIAAGRGTVEVGIKSGDTQFGRVYDIAPLFEHVHFDGDAFVRTHDGRVLSRPKNLAFAAIWEVGRIIHRVGA